VDEFGDPVLRWPEGQGGPGAPIHVVELVGQGCLALEVAGRSLSEAVMAAVDPSGRTVVTYRYSPSRFSSLLAGFGYRWRIEMVISPAGMSIPGIVTFAGLTAREMIWNFASKSGGG
jgi:hypothetical protein